MPLELSRPKKIPVGGGDTGGIRRFDAEKLEDGSWVVTCYHGKGMDMGEPKKYTATNDNKMLSLIRGKVTPDTGEPRPVAKAAVVAKAPVPKAAPAPPEEPELAPDSGY